MRVEVWSDLVCPWCYVGKRRLEDAVARRHDREPVTVVHRAYLLYGSAPRGATFNRRDILMQKYHRSGADVDRMNAAMEATAAAAGLEYHLSGGVTGNTFDAHQVIVYARDQDIESTVLERLYRAFFTEGRSIFSHDALIALGVDAGLDGAEIARVLQEDRYAATIEADIEQARRVGVTGVPFFVFDDRYALSGAQPPEVFDAALVQATVQATAQATAAPLPSRPA